MVSRDMVGTNAVYMGLLMSLAATKKAEPENFSSAHLRSRNRVLALLNAFFADIFRLSENDSGERGEDRDLRSCIQGIADQLFRALSEPERVSWGKIETSFISAWGSNLTPLVFAIAKSGVHTCRDETARRAAVRMCQQLFGAVQADGFYEQIPDLQKVTDALLKVLETWRDCAKWPK